MLRATTQSRASSYYSKFTGRTFKPLHIKLLRENTRKYWRYHARIQASHWFLSTKMTSSNGNIFRVIGPLGREFTGHQSPVNSLHKCQWRTALKFSLICAWVNSWVNNCEAGHLRRHRAHYDVSVMDCVDSVTQSWAWYWYQYLCNGKCVFANDMVTTRL